MDTNNIVALTMTWMDAHPERPYLPTMEDLGIPESVLEAERIQQEKEHQEYMLANGGRKWTPNNGFYDDDDEDDDRFSL